MDINWIMGRGLSIDCNLRWEVPAELNVNTEVNIEIIKTLLKEEMKSADTSIIKKFLDILESKTKNGFRHRLITTNWDELIEKEIDKKFPIGSHKPYWLTSSFVYHLNGTIKSEENCNRSPFLLESDDALQRLASLEANTVLNKIITDKFFIIVGVSFDCQTDQDFLNQLSKIEDYLHIGDSTWIILNPCSHSLELVSERIKKALPNSKIILVQQTFSSWIKYSKMKEIVDLNILKAL